MVGLLDTLIGLLASLRGLLDASVDGSQDNLDIIPGIQTGITLDGRGKGVERAELGGEVLHCASEIAETGLLRRHG